MTNLMLSADPELVSRVKEFVALKKERAEHEASSKRLKERIDELENQLSETFIERGVQSIKVDGATISLREEVWPALVVPDGYEKDQARLSACHILEEMGRGSLVTYNQQSMRALVKEMSDDEGALPEPLGRFVRAEKRYKVAARGIKGDDD